MIVPGQTLRKEAPNRTASNLETPAVRAETKMKSVEIPRAFEGGVLVMYHRYALHVWFRTVENQYGAPWRRVIQRAASRRIGKLVGI